MGNGREWECWKPFPHISSMDMLLLTCFKLVNCDILCGFWAFLHWSYVITAIIFPAASCRIWGCKNRPAPFLAGCHTRQLSHALCVLSLSLDLFLSVCVVLLNMATFLHFVICVFYLLIVLVRLSVSVQVIDWKDLSPKWPIMCWWGH